MFEIRSISPNNVVVPFTSVANVRVTQRMNRPGEATWEIPAEEARAAGLTVGMRYQIRHSRYGYLGEFVHEEIEVDASERIARVRALDLLALLNKEIVVRSYSNATIHQVLSEILPGWLGYLLEIGAYFGPITLQFEGETILQALDALRQALRGYFTLTYSDNNAPLLFLGRMTNLGQNWSQYGGFVYGGGRYKGDLAAVPAETKAWLINPPFADADGERRAVITRLIRRQAAAGVVNRLYPVGSGQGQAAVTLRYSDRSSPYQIQSSSKGYYIEDSQSIARYGLVERAVKFDVRPVTNSLADLRAAANGVYDLAAAYLQRYNYPHEHYQCSCVGLPWDVAPGSIVVLQFYGVVEKEGGASAFLTLEDAPFYVVERTAHFDSSGGAVWDLQVSNSGEALAEEIDVFTNLLADMQRLRLRPAPSQTYYCKTGPTQFIAPLKNAVAKVWIGPEVLYVNELRLECVVAPLRAQFSIGPGGGETITTSNAGGETLWTTSGGSARYSSNAGGGSVLFTEYAVQVALNPHAHVINIPAHTHEIVFPAHQHIVALPVHAHALTVPAHTHAQDWGVVEDSSTISNLSVWLDGVQVAQIVNAETKQPMGPSVSAYGTYEADLMPILEALGDYRSRMHILEFRLMGGRAQIWAQVVGRITIQPIAV